MISEDLVRSTLATVKYPGFSRDIVSFGLVKGVRVDGSDVQVDITLATRDANIPRQVHEQATAALSGLKGIGAIKLNFDIKEPPNAPGGPQNSVQAGIPGVKHVIAVASGKGGVGKSTVSANLAVALSRTGARVGLCDCDLYGPSIAFMFGTDERPYATEDNQIVPIQRYGLQLMSMGFLLDDESPVIVRGPMATRYTQQFLRQCAWENLDYLILDLPPGTGDIQLTIVQTVALSGAVLVTTPQEVALIDARKAASMFAKVNVPILGIVENMSHFVCPNDGNIYHIFGKGGGEREAKRLGVPMLAHIPLEIQVRESGDGGKPVALEDPAEHPASKAFQDLAQKLLEIVPGKTA
jgi:ATP-binding protein involved in chromosome partitioning